MKRQQFKQQLKRQKFARFALYSVGAIVSMLLLVFISLRIYAQVAGAPALTVTKASIFLDSQGNQIGDYYTDERRYWTSLDDMSPYLVTATVSVEDKDFYNHNGFDYSRIAGAIVADIKAGSMVQGASTLTMQYARNLYLSHDKTFSRKLNEALYAYRLERFYTKDEILEGYLNTVYYGHGMYGVEAASRYYYGKSAKDLSLAEAAMLSGIPKGPTYYSPTVNFEKAKNRQLTILQLMVDQGKITIEEQQQASEQQLVFKTDEWTASQTVAPYFIDAVLAEAENVLAAQNIAFSEGGWTIQTTLNQAHQQAAEKAIANNMKNDELQLGFISMEPKTGYITALVGGQSYQDSPFNRVISAKRSPGSTIKPILYAAALEEDFSPLTLLDVSKTTFKYDDGKKEYTPQNVNKEYADHDMSMMQALAISDNVYAVKTLDTIGYDAFRDMLERFQLPFSEEDNPSMALGTKEVSLLELTSAYNTIAAGGVNRPGTTILSIKNSNGDIVYEYKKDTTRIIEKDDAFMLTHMMTGIFNSAFSDYSPVTGNAIRNQLTHTYAGKTGSTNTDQWMIGYTPSLTAGVWNGYDQGKTLDVDVDAPATKQIWRSFMETVLANTENESFEAPDTLTKIDFHLENGCVAQDDTEQTVTMYVKEEHIPSNTCSSFNVINGGLWDSIVDWFDKFRR